MALASPGVQVKEIDFTATVQVADQNIGVIAVDAQKGPTDVVTYLSSERELVDTFGSPGDSNADDFFVASEFLNYGGRLGVVRAETGAVNAGAAAIMVVVFMAFGLSSVVILKQIGLGLALAILLDATIVRALVVPSTMRLMGKWNWWSPQWMNKLFPSKSHEIVEDIIDE